jgi:hypothetical protein
VRQVLQIGHGLSDTAGQSLNWGSLNKVSQMEGAIATWESEGMRVFLPFFRSPLVECYLAQGRPEKAKESVWVVTADQHRITSRDPRANHHVPGWPFG